MPGSHGPRSRRMARRTQSIGGNMRSILLLLAVSAFGCATVDPGHRGLYFDVRHGLQHEVLTPGRHWTGPFDRIEDFDVTYSTKEALLTFSWMAENAEGRQFSDGERAAGRSRRVIERVRTKVGVAWGLFKVTSHPYPHARYQFTAFSSRSEAHSCPWRPIRPGQPRNCRGADHAGAAMFRLRLQSPSHLRPETA